MNESRPAIEEHRLPRSAVSWLLRISIVALIAIAIIRLIWGAVTWRALSAQMDAMRRDGWPIHVDDIQSSDPVPAEDDAWPLFVQAMNAVSPTVDTPSNSNIQSRNFPPYSSEWIRLAAASERANAPVFALTARAMQMRSASVPVQTNPMAVMGTLGFSRALASVLGDNAIYAHIRGNDDQAIDRIAQAVRLADVLHQTDSLITELVAAGIESMGITAAQQIATGLKHDAAHPASREQIERLIAQLLNEDRDADELWKRVARTFANDRTFELDQSLGQSSRVWLVRPLIYRAAARANENAQVGIEATSHQTYDVSLAFLATKIPSWPNVRAFRAARQSEPETVRYSRWFGPTGEDAEGFARIIGMHFRRIAERRATAVCLAVALYRMDHGDRFPSDLVQLVPNYLQALPADPYYADGRPMQIVMKRTASGAERPMLSFGAAEEASDPLWPEPLFGWQPMGAREYDRAVRQYRDLSRFYVPLPPPPPTEPNAVTPSTQAVDERP